MADHKCENEWLGKDKTTARGQEYEAFKRAGITYCVGDIVRLHTPDAYTLDGHDMNYYVARINRMWSTGDDDLMDVTWFYAPEDTKGGRKKRDASRELFCSSVSDTNFAETVVGHAMVVDEDFFKQWCAGQSTTARGKAAAASTAAGEDPYSPDAWTLDWKLRPHNACVPLFFCKRSYEARTGKRAPVNCAMPPPPPPPNGRATRGGGGDGRGARPARAAGTMPSGPKAGRPSSMPAAAAAKPARPTPAAARAPKAKAKPAAASRKRPASAKDAAEAGGAPAAKRKSGAVPAKSPAAAAGGSKEIKEVRKELVRLQGLLAAAMERVDRLAGSK